MFNYYMERFYMEKFVAVVCFVLFYYYFLIKIFIFFNFWFIFIFSTPDCFGTKTIAMMFW